MKELILAVAKALTTSSPPGTACSGASVGGPQVLHFAALRGQEGIRVWLTVTGTGGVLVDTIVSGPSGRDDTFTDAPWTENTFGALILALLECGLEPSIS